MCERRQTIERREGGGKQVVSIFFHLFALEADVCIMLLCVCVCEDSRRTNEQAAQQLCVCVFIARWLAHFSSPHFFSCFKRLEKFSSIHVARRTSTNDSIPILFRCLSLSLTFTYSQYLTVDQSISNIINIQVTSNNSNFPCTYCFLSSAVLESDFDNGEQDGKVEEEEKKMTAHKHIVWKGRTHNSYLTLLLSVSGFHI